MRMPKRFPVPIEKICLPLSGREIWVLREELSHPHYGGNKYWKLKQNIAQLHAEGKNRLVTMGGAYSNHIFATAALCRELDLPCMGIIRGERPPVLSPTLQFAEACGMHLQFISRGCFRQLREEGPVMLGEMYNVLTDHWVPEGGSNAEGVRGCAEWALEIPDTFDRVALACGSGGSLAGLAGGKASMQFWGVNVLKGDFMDAAIQKLQKEAFGASSSNWHIENGYHGGGYGKLTEAMKAYMTLFEERTNILLDPVYTVKLFYALDHLRPEHGFARDEKILAIHTGGLQGRAS